MIGKTIRYRGKDYLVTEWRVSEKGERRIATEPPADEELNKLLREVMLINRAFVFNREGGWYSFVHPKKDMPETTSITDPDNLFPGSVLVYSWNNGVWATPLYRQGATDVGVGHLAGSAPLAVALVPPLFLGEMSGFQGGLS